MNLQLKFLLPSSIIMIVVMVIILLTTVTHVRQMARQDMKIIGEQTGAHLSEVIASKFHSSLNRAETLGNVFETFQHNYMMVTRFEANRILKSFIERNPDVLNIYVIMEPDAIFGQDPAYAYQPGHDSQGNFVPCWTRDEESHGFLEALGDFSTLADEPFYQKSKEFMKPAMLRPFVQRIQGKDILVSSVIIPLFDRTQKFMGIIGIDIPLEDIQEMIRQVTIYEDGYLSIFSSQGDIVGGPDHAELGKNIRDVEGNVRFIQKVIAGKQFILQQHSKYLDRVVLTYGFPIKLDDEDPWMVTVNIPRNRIYAHLRHIYIQIIVTSSIAFLILLGLLYYLSRVVTGSLKQIVERMKAISTGNGDLTSRIPVNSNDEVGQLANSFNHFVDTIHEIILQVKINTDVVVEKALGIRHTSHHLENGAAEQQNDTRHAVESIQAITGSIISNTQITHEAADLSKEAGDVSLEGLKAMNQNLSDILTIEEHTNATRKIIDDLADRSQQITSIAEMIQDIASRTKVLALNASIEAIQAGDAGKGFNIISREIRELALKTTEATDSVRVLIDEIQTDVQRILHAMTNTSVSVGRGKDAANHAQKVLESIQNKIIATSRLVQRIDETCLKQSETAQQISAHIKAINSVAEGTQSEVTQMANTADQMSLNSNNLRRLIYQFHLRDDQHGIGKSVDHISRLIDTKTPQTMSN